MLLTYKTEHLSYILKYVASSNVYIYKLLKYVHVSSRQDLHVMDVNESPIISEPVGVD